MLAGEGMIVVDECVAAAMGVWMVWLGGRFTNRPYGAIAQRPERVRDTWICAAFPLPCPSGWRFRPLRRRFVPE